MQIAISGSALSVGSGLGGPPSTAATGSSAMLASRFVETSPVERVATSSMSTRPLAAAGSSGTIAQKPLR